VFRRHQEIWYALIGIAGVTALYLVSYLAGGYLPGASGFVGHGIGIVGFILMLMTETLYSIRKHRTDARWGNMADWLRFHMVTGLVGPYMVLLHTSMRFRGLAGVAMLLTVVVTVSGVIGRYIYTAVPRMSEAVEPDAEADRLTVTRGALARWHSFHVPLTWALFITALVHMGGALYYATLQR
jgi:hypothetical protein